MQRKLPLLTADNRDFWTGGAVQELRIYFCPSCSRLFHPPAPLCPRCAGFDVYAKVVSGTGRILTFTINYQDWVPGLQTPYVVAIVELDEDTDIQPAARQGLSGSPAAIFISSSRAVRSLQKLPAPRAATRSPSLSLQKRSLPNSLRQDHSRCVAWCSGYSRVKPIAA